MCNHQGPFVSVWATVSVRNYGPIRHPMCLLYTLCLSCPQCVYQVHWVFIRAPGYLSGTLCVYQIPCESIRALLINSDSLRASVCLSVRLSIKVPVCLSALQYVCQWPFVSIWGFPLSLSKQRRAHEGSVCPVKLPQGAPHRWKGLESWVCAEYTDGEGVGNNKSGKVGDSYSILHSPPPPPTTSCPHRGPDILHIFSFYDHHYIRR